MFGWNLQNIFSNMVMFAFLKKKHGNVWGTIRRAECDIFFDHIFQMEVK